MSDHSEHFIPSAGGPVWEPDPRCPTCMGPEMPPPIDWPARFRAAAEVAWSEEIPGTAQTLERLAEQLYSLDIAAPRVVEAIGQALLGETP